jgi:hypothetical protein
MRFVAGDKWEHSGVALCALVLCAQGWGELQKGSISQATGTTAGRFNQGRPRPATRERYRAGADGWGGRRCSRRLGGPSRRPGRSEEGLCQGEHCAGGAGRLRSTLRTAATRAGVGGSAAGDAAVWGGRKGGLMACCGFGNPAEAGPRAPLGTHGPGVWLCDARGVGRCSSSPCRFPFLSSRFPFLPGRQGRGVGGGYGAFILARSLAGREAAPAHCGCAAGVATPRWHPDGVTGGRCHWGTVSLGDSRARLALARAALEDEHLCSDVRHGVGRWAAPRSAALL